MRSLFVAMLLTSVMLTAGASAGAASTCRPRVSAPAVAVRGASLVIRYAACRAGSTRVGLVALEDAHRGNVALRRTLTLRVPGSETTTLTLGALATGRYRLVLIDAAHRVTHASRAVRIVPGPPEIPPTFSDTPFPPALSGCGESGPTRSATPPKVAVAPVARLLRTGRVRLVVRGNETGSALIELVQAGGRRVAATNPGTYTCFTPRSGAISLPLSSYARRIVHRHGRLAVTLIFRLSNGSGVRGTQAESASIRRA